MSNGDPLSSVGASIGDPFEGAGIRYTDKLSNALRFACTLTRTWLW